MLVLRKAQIEVLAADLDRRTEERLYTALREHHASEFESIGETGARARFRAGLDQAQRWGLERWVDIAFVVDLLFRYGSYDHPTAAPLRRIFERSDIAGGQKTALAELALRRQGR